MSGSARIRSALLMSVMAMTVLFICAQAWAWPWDKKDDVKYPEVKLEQVMKSPQTYMGREVSFTARFALRGNLFKHYNTRFTPGEHANFAVWSLDTKLWDKASRRNVLPTLYVDKSKKGVFSSLRDLKRYDKVEINGRVVNTYAGLPWILVDAVKVVPELDACEEPIQITDTAITHVANGLTLRSRGEARLAARHLEMALEGGLPPEHRHIVVSELAKSLAESKSPAKAIEYYEQAIEGDPENAEMHFSLAKLYLEDEQPGKALEYAEKTLKLASGYSEAYAVKGEALGMLGQVEEALEAADLAATLPGNTPMQTGMAYVYKARILAHAERYADASREYAKAIGEGSDLTGAAWLRKEVGALYEGRFDATGNTQLLEDAKLQYDNANVMSNNNDPEGLFLAARAAFKLAKAEKTGNYDEAIKLADEAIGVDSRYVQAMLLKGQIALEQGNSQEADAIFEKVANMNGHDVAPLMTLAEYYESTGQVDQARSVYEKALRIKPHERKLLERHAELCESLGMVDAAQRSYETLAEIQPQNANYTWKLARIAYLNDDLQKAAPALETVSASGGVYATEATVLLAEVKVLQGDPGAAERILRNRIEGEGDNPTLLAALSKLLSDQAKRPAEALELAVKANGMIEGDAKVKDALGWALVQNDKAAEAMNTFAQIADSQKTRATWYHQAVAHYYARDFVGARMAAQMAAQPTMSGENASAAKVIVERAEELIKMIGDVESQVRARDAAKRDEAAMAKQREEMLREVEARRSRSAEMSDAAEELLRKAEEISRAAKELEIEGVESSGFVGESEVLVPEGDAAQEPVVTTPTAPTVPSEVPEDHATLAGNGESMQNNTVENLPGEMNVRDDILGTAAAMAEIQVEEMVEAEDAVNAPVQMQDRQSPVGRSEMPMPVEREEVQPSRELDLEIPAMPIPEPVPTKPEPTVPTNDINDLPDWAM